MSGTEKQDGHRANTSVYLDDRHRKMADTLVSSRHYKSFSEMVRSLIEKDFADKMADPRAELIKARKELEGIINVLQDYVTESDAIIEEVVTKYKIRKQNLPAKALIEYEKFSKNWIAQNASLVEEAFPGKSINEIYEELEKRIKKDE